MELTAAVLMNVKTFKENDIRKHVARFPKAMKKRVYDSFDELTELLRNGEDIPPRFKPHKVNSRE